MEEKKYPIGGYAPGNYHNRCVTCERSFFGDKQAVQCELCALKNNSTNEQLSGADQVCGKTELNNLSAIPVNSPGSSYQPLFDYLTKEHGLTLLESQMDDLINVVHKFHPKGAAWVKAKERTPIGHSSDYHWRFIHNKKPINRNFHIESGRLIQEYGNTKGSYSLEELEWLDEQPAAAREEDAVLLIKYIRENYKKRKDGWTDNFNIARLTDQGIYELFKQQKEK